MSRPPVSARVAKNETLALTIKVPCSGRRGQPGYVATCALKSVQAVSDAEVDLFDAIFKQQPGEREFVMRAHNDNRALETLSPELAESPQA